MGLCPHIKVNIPFATLRVLRLVFTSSWERVVTLAATVTLVPVAFGVEGPDLTAAAAPLVPEARPALLGVFVLLAGAAPELLVVGVGPDAVVCRPERLVTAAVVFVPLLLLAEEELDPVDAVDELLPRGDAWLLLVRLALDRPVLDIELFDLQQQLELGSKRRGCLNDLL